MSHTDIIGLRKFTADEEKLLDDVYDITEEDALTVKKIETAGLDGIPATNHDVKAVEYFIKRKLKDTSLADVLEMVHFSLTSEDINNISLGMMIRDGVNEVILPHLEMLYSQPSFVQLFQILYCIPECTELLLQKQNFQD